MTFHNDVPVDFPFKDKGPNLNELSTCHVMVHMQFGCVHSILLVKKKQNCGAMVDCPLYFLPFSRGQVLCFLNSDTDLT